MFGKMKDFLAGQLSEIRGAGLAKEERVISSPQGAWIKLQDGREALNLCSNNYLGLSNHPGIVKAAREGLEKWGNGLSSVRFICGTQALHKELEERVTKFLGMEDTILYSSCFDANGGFFETVLDETDAVISDALNHASIIDGVRLCKAQRLRFQSADMRDLEAKLKEAAGARFKVIATDGVFSMDGTIANLPAICDLAEKCEALVMVDDSHGVGVLGENGRGTHEYHKVVERIDILTGTFGKALGGASGGYASGRRELIAMLRQRSRPYLFSNSVAPAIAASAMKALEMLSASNALVRSLREKTKYFRERMLAAGFSLARSEHPIIPVLLGEAQAALKMAERLLQEGVYVVAFSYPVVPKGSARIRIQISAGFSESDLDFALEKLAQVGAELKIIEK